MRYRNELIIHDNINNILHNIDIERALIKHEYIHNHKDVVYKPEEVEKVIEFIESEFMQTKGILEPIKLEPAQKWWIEIMFGYYDKDGHILINEIFINIIRGAGKSTLMAAIVITWMLLSDNFGGEGQVIAYDKKQADEVFGQVLKQLQAGGEKIKFLSKKRTVRYNGKIVNIPEQLKTTREGVLFKHNLNSFRKQTNDESTVQGGNTVFNVFDEVHTYKKPITEVVNMGSRKQKNWRSIYITSGGITRGGQYDMLIKQFTSDDDFKDIHTFGFIYRLDDANEVKEKINWTKAAPMIGSIPTWSKVEREYKNASGDPVLQSRFLAYNMGIQTKDAMYYFNETETAPYEYDYDYVWNGAEVWLGVDVSYSNDWSSVSFLTQVGNEWYVHTESVATKSSIKDLKAQDVNLVNSFEGNGLTIIDNDRIKARDIFDVASSFIDKYSLNIQIIGYDRYNYDELHDLFFDYYVADVDDARQKSIRQHFYLSESLNLMKTLLMDGRLHHNQPVLQWSLLNLGVRIGTSGDIMMKKFSNAEKIDPVAATAFAIEVSK